MGRIVVRIVIAALVAASLPANVLAAPPAATFDVTLRGDCSGLTVDARWANQKQARSYRVTLVATDSPRLESTGAAGRSGSIGLAFTPRADPEEHTITAEVALLDRTGQAVATARGLPVTGFCIV